MAGVAERIISIEQNNIDELKDTLVSKKGWLMGHISYDFKNHLFPLSSKQENNINFPDIFLFEPEIVIKLIGNKITIESEEFDCNTIYKNILSTNVETQLNDKQGGIIVKPKISKQEYIDAVNTLKNHIQLGDCYEINFCQEFYAENTEINPLELYSSLSKVSPTPFGAYYKLLDKYILCASPERFIKKIENKIISQPIKGTAKRILDNSIEDEKVKLLLQQSQKEKSENVMIVDLVRNDLSKICKAGTVKVEELMHIYSFKQVHQMISTVVGELKDNISFYDVLKALFPMGSMTGAPKYKVMQLIEQYEKTQRNIYSGSVGYITPDNDFDFNVVIRSIAYNQTSKYLNYEVGGAITHYCNAEKEYEECLLKASAIEKVLNNFL